MHPHEILQGILNQKLLALNQEMDRASATAPSQAFPERIQTAERIHKMAADIKSSANFQLTTLARLQQTLPPLNSMPDPDTQTFVQKVGSQLATAQLEVQEIQTKITHTEFQIETFANALRSAQELQNIHHHLNRLSDAINANLNGLATSYIDRAHQLGRIKVHAQEWLLWWDREKLVSSALWPGNLDNDCHEKRKSQLQHLLQNAEDALNSLNKSLHAELIQTHKQLAFRYSIIGATIAIIFTITYLAYFAHFHP